MVTEEEVFNYLNQVPKRINIDDLVPLIEDKFKTLTDIEALNMAKSWQKKTNPKYFTIYGVTYVKHRN